jgi:hypothetical protein
VPRFTDFSSKWKVVLHDAPPSDRPSVAFSPYGTLGYGHVRVVWGERAIHDPAARIIAAAASGKQPGESCSETASWAHLAFRISTSPLLDAGHADSMGVLSAPSSGARRCICPEPLLSAIGERRGR